MIQQFLEEQMPVYILTPIHSPHTNCVDGAWFKIIRSQIEAVSIRETYYSYTRYVHATLYDHLFSPFV